MIKGLQGITGVSVGAGNTSLPYVNPNPNNPMTGMIRINNTDLEVFNGSNWQMISASYATVGLDQEVLDIIQWARKKRDEEKEILALAQTNSAVKNALDAVERAKEQLKIIKDLSIEH
jgi:hypothetical protein